MTVSKRIAIVETYLGKPINREMQNKQKVTLYIPPKLHRQLKIRAAVDTESMSAIAEKAIAFYMEHSEVAEEELLLETDKHAKEELILC
ncbi:MAG: hypothetical protein GDA44_03565 [Prochloron sp. SP5CPC1]|nr:hypothetical protein [Candidatus Paraprochloron terpiosi SP5CPC1]